METKSGRTFSDVLSRHHRQRIMIREVSMSLGHDVKDQIDVNQDGHVSSQELNTWLQNLVKVQQKTASELPPTRRQLWQLALLAGIPFVGFGFVDNGIMLVCGDVIDTSLGRVLGISTLAAAGLGNLVSDVAGLGLGGYIEASAKHLGLKDPMLSLQQMNTRTVRVVQFVATSVGISIGCLLGMFPLLFMDAEEKEMQEMFDMLSVEHPDGVQFTHLLEKIEDSADVIGTDNVVSIRKHVEHTQADVSAKLSYRDFRSIITHLRGDPDITQLPDKKHFATLFVEEMGNGCAPRGGASSLLASPFETDSLGAESTARRRPAKKLERTCEACGGTTAAADTAAARHLSFEEEQDVYEGKDLTGSLLDDCTAVLMQSFPASNHQVSFFLRCFTRNEAAEALVESKRAKNAAHATRICARLLRRGIMRPVHGSGNLYFFVTADQNDVSSVEAREHFLNEFIKREDECTSTSNGSNSSAEAEFETQSQAGSHGLRLLVMRAASAPISLRGWRESHYFVRVRFQHGGLLEERITTPRVSDKDGDEPGRVNWMEFVNLGFAPSPETNVEISLLIQHRRVDDEELGSVHAKLRDLLGGRPVELLLANRDSNCIVKRGGRFGQVTVLHVVLEQSSVPRSWDSLRPKDLQSFDRHVLMITRGTRGDVQPFVAVARTLANSFNWLVTICTELRFKTFVENNARGLDKGRIQFRVAGGDTQKRVDGKLAKWALHLDSSLMQHLMMAYSEAEFFDSEPTIYHWAKTLRPNLLIFGFTLAHVAMNVSSALGIPLMGLILQPTCIPSKEYPPLHGGAGHRLANHVRHVALTSLKVILETNPLTGDLNTMRNTRGLPSIGGLILDIFQGNAWMHLQERQVPLIVPINPVAFGGKPRDWGPQSVLTNYVFLRDPEQELDEPLDQFIEDACARGERLVVLAFSSMPIEPCLILSIAKNLVEACVPPVSVVALTGKREGEAAAWHGKQPDEAEQEHVRTKRLFVAKSAPFGKLFPRMHAIVTHGGLGATGEALIAGVPVIVTGVLLFDQRFWGRRCHMLGVGPAPLHISSFASKCTDLVNRAVAPESDWAKNAKRKRQQIVQSLEADPTGTELSAACVHAMSRIAPVFQHGKLKYDFYKRVPSAHSCASSTPIGNTLTTWVGLFHKAVHWTVFVATVAKSKTLGL
ncbi:Transmembrane protein 65 [Durusdinium trenchii]|uniref:Transmembrane protein 65 n=1 Tax=Durusdinium trenchii TaxID=1381693 RepID=A0ABP0H8M0_9DINO